MSVDISMGTRIPLISLLLINVIIINSVIVFMRRYLEAVPSGILGILILSMLLATALYAFAGYGIYRGMRGSLLLVFAGILLHLTSISILLALSPSTPLSIAFLASMVTCAMIVVSVLKLKI